MNFVTSPIVLPRYMPRSGIAGSYDIPIFSFLETPYRFPCWLYQLNLHQYCRRVLFSPHNLSVQFSHSVMSNSLRLHESHDARPPCPSPTPGVHSDSVHRVRDAIKPSHPWSSPSPPAPNPSQHQSLFQWVNSSHEVANVPEFQLQHHSFQRNPRADLLQNGLVGSPCSPRDSQESSPTPQFKSINSLVLSLLHSPTITSIHDHRKNLSLE